MTAPYGTLAHEFPDFDAATLPEIPPGFVPAHWHNEVCPHWQFGEDPKTANLELWIDYADPQQRESVGEPRFLLQWFPDPAEGSRCWTIEHTDDWNLIMAALAHLDARVICARWLTVIGLGFHPDTAGVNYTEMVTGKRVFDDKIAAEYEADMERLFALEADPYEHGFAGMRAIFGGPTA